MVERNLKAITALLIATMFMVMVIPVAITDENSALTDDNVLSLDSQDCIIYCNVATGSTDNQHTFTVSGIPADYSVADVDWEFRNLGNGLEIAKFADNASTDSGETATVYAKSPGSIEVVAFIPGTEYIASALVVVFSSPGTHATTYNFYVKVDKSAMLLCRLNPQNFNIPDCVYNGTWISASQPAGTADADYNAWVAFKQACSTKGWTLNGDDNGWIQDFFGLGTYQSGTNWVYWTQYHADDGAWVFNNTTMGYMNTQDSCNLGVYFSFSSGTDYVPPFPGLPA